MQLQSQRQKLKAGFTLIELLVVIAIIALLSTIGFVAYSNARLKARDTKRIADLNQITKALELYYNENGQYPIPVDQYWSTAYSDSTYGWQNLQTALAPYLPTVPTDPLRNNSVMWAGPGNFGYAYGWVSKNAQGKWVYSLVANLEDTSNPLRCGANNDTRYPWHWGGGIAICYNGGPSGWSYSLQGYQASGSPPP